MNLKQFLIRKLMLFFALSTLITVAIYILGVLFPSLVTWSKRELKPREMLLREMMQFLLTEAVVLGLAFRSRVIDTSRSEVVLGIAGSVLVIYLLVFLISWAANSAEARETDRELREFQRLHGVDLCVPGKTAPKN